MYDPRSVLTLGNVFVVCNSVETTGTSSTRNIGVNVKVVF